MFSKDVGRERKKNIIVLVSKLRFKFNLAYVNLLLFKNCTILTSSASDTLDMLRNANPLDRPV